MLFMPTATLQALRLMPRERLLLTTIHLQRESASVTASLLQSPTPRVNIAWPRVPIPGTFSYLCLPMRLLKNAPTAARPSTRLTQARELIITLPLRKEQSRIHSCSSQWPTRSLTIRTGARARPIPTVSTRRLFLPSMPRSLRSRFLATE